MTDTKRSLLSESLSSKSSDANIQCGITWKPGKYKYLEVESIGQSEVKSAVADTGDMKLKTRKDGKGGTMWKGRKINKEGELQGPNITKIV